MSKALSSCVILVTARSFGMANPGLRRELEAAVADVRYVPGPLTADQLAGALQGVDGLIAGLDQIDASVFRRSPGLRVIARHGVGVDRVDLAAAACSNVTVTTTPGANSNAVAELTLALLFLLARPLVRGHAEVRLGHWPAISGSEISGCTIGLVGLGRIGSLVALKARALGMRVIASDPYVQKAAADRAGAVLVDLGAVSGDSDFVSLHAPLTVQTAGIIGRAFLENMRAGAALINTARAELINEAALIWALDHGPLRAAALDVLAPEPPAPGDRLLQRDDVLITPHLGSHTSEANQAMGRIALGEVLAVLSGRSPRFPATSATRSGNR